MSNQEETTYIPDESEVTASASRSSWRCANGKICKGSEDDGTLVTREKLVGRLRRIGIHDAVYSREGKDRRVYQLEADIETRAGMERIKASLCDLRGNDQPSGVAIGLAWGLLQIAKDEVLVITATQGTKKNEFGSYSTFVNTFTLPDGKTTAVEVPRRPRSDDPMEETLEKLLAEIRTHPAFADRPAHETDDDDGNATTHLSALVKECAAKAWPSPEQAPGEWLAIVAALLGQQPKSSIAQVSDDEWGQIRLGFQARTEKFAAEGKAETVPALLQPAVERLAKPVVAAGVLD